MSVCLLTHAAYLDLASIVPHVVPTSRALGYSTMYSGIKWVCESKEARVKIPFGPWFLLPANDTLDLSFA